MAALRASGGGLRQVYALASIGERAMPALIEATRDPVERVRLLVARALAKMPAALPCLERVRRTDVSVAVRNAAGEAIFELTERSPDPIADTDVLLDWLGSSESAIRDIGISELGLRRISDPVVLKALGVHVVRDANAACRASAALALQRINETRAFIVAALMTALDDPEALVSKQAREALAHLRAETPENLVQ